jgi:hypothetical protein
MADAQKRQNYAEVCRWSVFAERERAISKWEAEQARALRASQLQQQQQQLEQQQLQQRQSTPSTPASARTPSSASGQGHVEYGPTSWDDPFSSQAGPSRSTARPRFHAQESPSPYQTVVEVPTPLMDRSQALSPDAAFSFGNQNQGHALGHGQGSYQIPSAQMNHLPSRRSSNTNTNSNINVSDVPSIRLSRSSSNSMHRHIPAQALRMAPTPLRPRIDHQPISYPSPQQTMLSFVAPQSHVNQGALGTLAGSGSSSPLPEAMSYTTVNSNLDTGLTSPTPHSYASAQLQGQVPHLHQSNQNSNFSQNQIPGAVSASNVLSPPAPAFLRSGAVAPSRANAYDEHRSSTAKSKATWEDGWEWTPASRL